MYIIFQQQTCFQNSNNGIRISILFEGDNKTRNAAMLMLSFNHLIKLRADMEIILKPFRQCDHFVSEIQFNTIAFKKYIGFREQFLWNWKARKRRILICSNNYIQSSKIRRSAVSKFPLFVLIQFECAPYFYRESLFTGWTLEIISVYLRMLWKI